MTSTNDVPYTIVVESLDQDDPFLNGIIVGLAAGGVAAWLLAPRSGADTRRLIAERVRQTGELVYERFYQAQTTVRLIFSST